MNMRRISKRLIYHLCVFVVLLLGERRVRSDHSDQKPPIALLEKGEERETDKMINENEKKKLVARERKAHLPFYSQTVSFSFLLIITSFSFAAFFFFFFFFLIEGKVR